MKVAAKDRDDHATNSLRDVLRLRGGSLLHGQQPAAPLFKGGVTLVTIDVTVLDREGRPVSGLTAADFQVKLNGRVQPVRPQRRDPSADRTSTWTRR